MIYEPLDINLFKEKAQHWASSFSTVCILDSNNYKDPYGTFSLLVAVGIREEISGSFQQNSSAIQRFVQTHSDDIIPGYISYNLEASFFLPEITLRFSSDQVFIKADNPTLIIDTIESWQVSNDTIGFDGKVKQRMSREEYGEAFRKMKYHILKGYIYEVNLCQEFFAENANLNSFAAYKHLTSISPTPFACFFKQNSTTIICASPERFLARKGNRLISQPIKGTAARRKNVADDLISKENLQKDPKEVSENIMIVDLVRNDLTMSALPATVHVDELMGVYSFQQVHQLISTISCTINPLVNSTQAILNTFPPGSMTGAPKISAINLIEKIEKSGRGMYSGSIGYFDGLANFDFNVVIRSIIYNSKTKYLSYHVGGAITVNAEEEQEYQECLLKASAIKELLSSTESN